MRKYANYGTLLIRLTNFRCSFTSALSRLHTIIIKWADKKIRFPNTNKEEKLVSTSKHCGALGFSEWAGVVAERRKQ